MKKKANVMFTACCGWPTCGTIDCARQSDKYDFRIIGVDANPITAALNYVDVLYKVPKFYEDGYIQQMLEICDKENIDVIVPLISDEINILNENRELFESKGIKFLMSGKDCRLDIANDKFKLWQYLLSNGIDIMPKSIMLTKDNVDEALSELGYPDKPVCLKCTDGCGSSGFRIIDDKGAHDIVFSRSRATRSNKFLSKDQLVNALDTLEPDFMLQEYVSGEELGTICLVDNGKTLFSPSHRNLLMDFSTTTYCELVNDTEANAIVNEINAMFKFSGNIGYDFMRSDSGKLVLMEINPRISATVSLSAKAGLNLVALGVEYALGETIDTNIVPQYGLRLMRNYGTLYEKDGKAYGR